MKRQTGHASDTMLDCHDYEAYPAADNSSAALGRGVRLAEVFFASGIVAAGLNQGYILYVTKPPS